MYVLTLLPTIGSSFLSRHLSTCSSSYTGSWRYQTTKCLEFEVLQSTVTHKGGGWYDHFAQSGKGLLSQIRNRIKIHEDIRNRW